MNTYVLYNWIYANAVFAFRISALLLLVKYSFFCKYIHSFSSIKMMLTNFRVYLIWTLFLFILLFFLLCMHVNGD